MKYQIVLIPKGENNYAYSPEYVGRGENIYSSINNLLCDLGGRLSLDPEQLEETKKIILDLIGGYDLDSYATYTAEEWDFSNPEEAFKIYVTKIG